MTTRVQFIVTDDLDEFESDGKVLTDIGEDGEKIIISLDGQVRELDLTAPHAAELRADMRRYLAAGHAPGQAPQSAVTPEKPRQLKGQGRRREIPGTRDFYRELREWAQASGRTVPMAGRNDAKKNYVYTGLTGPYLSYLEREARNGEDGGVAAARLGLARTLGLIHADHGPAAAAG